MTDRAVCTARRPLGARWAPLVVTLLVLMALPSVQAQAPEPLPSFEASGDFDETANNLIRVGFPTGENTSLYEIHYAGANFTSLAERDANLLANGFAGVADAWVRVTDEPGVPPTDNFRAAELMRCWWTEAETPELDLQNVETSPNWSETNYTGDDASYIYPDFEGTPHVPTRATAIICDLPGVARGMEVWFGITPVDADGAKVTEGLFVLSAITLAESARPGDIDMTPIIGWLAAISLSVVLTLFILRATTKRRGDKAGPLMIMPAMLMLALLTFYPVGYGIYISFTDQTASNYGEAEWVGLDNYEALQSDDYDYDGDGDPGFWRAFQFTLLWTFGCVFFHVVLGLAFAMLLESGLIGKTAWRTVLLVPWAVPAYISTLMWKGMLNQYGVVNELLGTSINFLGTNGWAKTSVIFVNIWLGFSFMTMTISGGLQSVPRNIYEAADVDGVGGWSKFRHLTLPMLMPTIVPVTMLGFIWTFNLFAVIYLLTGGGPDLYYGEPGGTDILVTFVFDIAFGPNGGLYGLAAAWSVVILVMLVVMSSFYLWLTKGGETLVD